MLKSGASLLLLVVCLSFLGGSSAQDLVFNASAILEAPIALGTDIFGVNSTTQTLNVTLSAVFCDQNGENCGNETLNGVPAATLLACGNAVTEDLTYSSERLSGTQTVIISPNSTSYFASGEPFPAFFCTVNPEDYLPAPIAITLNVTAIPNVTALTEPEQAAALAIFDTCCATGTCTRWDEANYAAAAAAGGDTNTTYTDFCNMESNSCTPEGNLVTLDLTGYGLSCDLGSISFSNFTQLEFLILSGNNLTGDFSSAAATAFANLTLKELRVNSNPGLGGELDPSTNGTVCDFVQNRGLEVFLIGGTNITGPLPSCFFDATSTLKQFYASLSGISGEFPTTFGESTQLQLFQAYGTGLTGSIPSLPGTLLKFNVSQNSLTGSIPDLSTTPYLVTLDLSNNQLDGAVPDSMADHPYLRLVDMRTNSLSGLPQAWTDGSQAPTNNPPLTNLLVSDNPLKSTFPIALESYPSLYQLDLDNTSMSGTLPDVPQGGFSQLLALYAANNELTGSIPDSWQNTALFALNTSEITSYTYFILANNTLSGDLPSFLGQPLPYTVVDLSGNNFSNECDASFLDLGLCANPPSPSPGAVPDSPPAGPAAEGQGDSSSGGGGGLSKGATAAIVIVVLLVVGVLGFVGYRYWRRRQQGVGGGGFQRFEDNGSLEMGRTNNNGIYNPQLAP